MPHYDRSYLTSGPEGSRTLKRLLRDRLATEVPGRTQEDTLLLATWNIRDFDKAIGGRRSEEAMHYIAEVISHFDLVAIQEVYKDLTGLNRLMKLLGRHWDYIVSDVTAGRSGNDERLAFVFDRRKVEFGGLCGELVLPPGRASQTANQPYRTPYMVGFKSGWTQFVLTTVHIQWGSSQADSPARVSEISKVAKFLKGRATDTTAWSRNQILLGDFNIFDAEDATMSALTDAGFELPPQLLTIPGSNARRNRRYDQIAFLVRKDRLETTSYSGGQSDLPPRDMSVISGCRPLSSCYQRLRRGSLMSPSSWDIPIPTAFPWP